MVNYINRNAAMASPDVLVVKRQTIAGNQGRLSVSIHRTTETSEGRFEWKSEAKDERMTPEGSKSRVEEIAMRFGIPVWQTDGDESDI